MLSIELWKFILTLTHVLAGAGWFGAMVYSLTTFQPRAKKYFASDEEFEEFISFVSAGARWKVLGAFGVMLASGLLLLIANWSRHASALWSTLMIVKLIAFLLATAMFVIASWRLWPRRIFARGEEIHAIQLAFRRVGDLLVGIAVIEFAAGIAARFV